MPRTRSIAVTAVLGALAAGLAPAAASAATSVRVTPATGATAGDRVVIRGSDWGTTEFCRPRATLRVLGVVIGRAVVDDRGTFRFRWVVPEAVGTGVRRISIRQNCESGKDGSLVLVRGTGWIAIR
jgi:hypothetical protein